MPDEPNAPAAPAAATESAPVATPQSDPTPAQAESKSVVQDLTDDIGDLWGKLDGLRVENQQPAPEPAPTEPSAPEATSSQEQGRQRDDKGRFVKAEAQPVSTEPAPTGEAGAETTTVVTDQATLEQQAYERALAKIEADRAAERAAQERIEAEQQFEREVGHYAGLPADRQAVREALRAANLGDMRLLDALDVTLPNGKRVSEVRPNGARGLSADEAQNLEIAWDNADRYGEALAGRKTQALISYWDRQTQDALRDPDVDAAAVRAHRTPGEQIKAAIDTTRASVEKRLGEKHAAELAARDKTIAEQAERITSLVNERGNVASQQRAAASATPDRPGQPGALRRDLPTPEQLQEMSADEAFKSGAIDRLLQIIPGGVGQPDRRRVG